MTASPILQQQMFAIIALVCTQQAYQKAYQKVLDHFAACDPIIHQVLPTVDLNRWFDKAGDSARGSDYFISLCRSIIGQQLSNKAADAIYGKFAHFFGDLYSPNQILDANDQIIRDIGLSWAKVRYVKDLAASYLANPIAFSKLDQLSDTEVIAQLTTVKGIGNWTAEMFLMFTLRRKDVFSYGDLGLRKGIMKLYTLEKPSVEQIEKIIAPWKPYKTFGSIALWHSLDNSR